MADTEIEDSAAFVLANSIPEPNSGCWLWTGAVDRNGYGKLARGRLAHRLSYEAHIGPIPHGALVLHSCDVTGCVNPSHLRSGDHMDNIKDAVARGRIRPNRGLTAEELQYIRANVRPYSREHPEFTVGALAKRFGVSRNTVQVVTRKGYAYSAFPELVTKRGVRNG